MNPNIPSNVLNAAAKATAADPQRDAAFAASFAPDYIDIGETRFYRLKVAHNWALLRINSLGLSGDDLLAVTAFMLMHDAEATRSSFIPLLFGDRNELILTSYQALAGTSVTFDDLNPVLEQYAADVEALTPSKKLKSPGAGATRSGGRGLSSHSAKPSGGAKQKH